MLNFSERAIRYLRFALWGLAVFQVVLALGGLGSSISQSISMKNMKLPAIPSKLGYNICISVFTFVILPACIALQWFKPSWWRTITVKFSLWPALVSSSMFTIFWIAATGTSFLTCDDMCSVYGPQWDAFIMYSNKLCCQCDNGRVSTIKCPKVSGGNKVSLGQDKNVITAYLATQGFSVLSMLSFMAFTTIWVLLVLQGGRSDSETPTFKKKDMNPQVAPTAYEPSRPMQTYESAGQVTSVGPMYDGQTSYNSQAFYSSQPSYNSHHTSYNSQPSYGGGHELYGSQPFDAQPYAESPTYGNHRYGRSDSYRM